MIFHHVLDISNHNVTKISLSLPFGTYRVFSKRFGNRNCHNPLRTLLKTAKQAGYIQKNSRINLFLYLIYIVINNVAINFLSSLIISICMQRILHDISLFLSLSTF